MRPRQPADREQRLDPLAPRVSPIPTSTPVVNGTASRPASSIMRRRTSGRLSGARRWGIPGSPRRTLAVSSIRPRLTLTGRRRAMSLVDRTPAFVCGKRPCSSARRRRAEVAHRAVVPPRRERCRRYAPEGPFGLVPELEQRLGAPLFARAGELLVDLVRRHRPLAGIARRPAERAVAAVVAAEVRDGQEHLRRVREPAPPAAVAHCGERALEERVELAVRRVGERQGLLVGQGCVDHAREPTATRRSPPRARPYGSV